jgi:ankyrin repeat protein
MEERWEFYGIRSRGTDSGVTDSAGRVEFPRHSFSVTEVSYLLSRGMSHLNVHASFGPSGSVMIQPEAKKPMKSDYMTDGKVYDDTGAHTERTVGRFETTLHVLDLDLFDFIDHQEWDAVKRIIIENPSSVTMRGRGGSTPLISVAQEGFAGKAEDMLRFLIEKGADINARADDGMTALLRAAQNHDLAEMEYLLSRKADVTSRIHESVFYTTNGFTPLHFQLGAYESVNDSCSAADRIKGIGLLLDHGADLNAKDTKGNTPLHLAAEWGDPEIVSVLLARGADARAVNTDGQTPLGLIKSLNDTPPVRQVKVLLSAAESQNSK